MDQNIFIACVHWKSGDWIHVQHDQFEKCLPSKPKHYAYLNKFDIEDVKSSFEYYSTDDIQKHNFKLNLLAEEISKSANEDDIIIFVDGDAYPIGDLQSYIDTINNGTPLIAVQRLENFGDFQPHPCFCMTTVGFWNKIQGNWNPGHTWKNELGEDVTDVGGNLLKKLEGIDWKNLNRTNRVDFHPLWFGVYDDKIYHHGAGFRTSISRIDHKILAEKQKTRPGYTYQILLDHNNIVKNILGQHAINKPDIIEKLFVEGNKKHIGYTNKKIAMQIKQFNDHNKMAKRWGKNLLIKHENFGNANYLKVLRNIHNKIDFNTYLEIGVRFGDSFKEAKNHCIGVDPEFRLKHNIMQFKKTTKLFQNYSDTFFQEEAQNCFKEKKIDIAFLDGLHTSDQLLMDFINTEKHCTNKSIIILHDALPRTLETVQRIKPQEITMWTGDVWKVVPYLKALRPELNFIFLDAPPSGLVLISNLNPNHTYAKSSDAMKEEIEKQPNDEVALNKYFNDIEITNATYFIKKITAEKKIDLNAFNKRAIEFA